MKEVMAVIRMNKINQTKRALADAGITSFTATGSVVGRGKGLVDFRIMQGAEKGQPEAIALLGEGPILVSKRLLLIIVPDDLVQKAVETIISANQTGNSGDGKIFVMPIMDAIKVRTGESGEGVLDQVERSVK
jgi:nitrogen regulatory protein PII 2